MKMKQIWKLSLAICKSTKSYKITLIILQPQLSMKWFLSSPSHLIEVIMREMKLNRLDGLDNNENNSSSKELIKAFDYFFFENGRFPMNEQLISVLEVTIPAFVNARSSDEKLS